MKLGIIGIGGHAKAVTDIAFNLGYNDVYYFDDYLKKDNFSLDGKFVGNTRKIEQFTDLEFVIAVGKNHFRKEIYFLFENKIKFKSLIHPSAYVSKDSKIGKGTVIMPNVTINSGVEIRDFVIINSNSVVEHDTKVGNFAHICPGVVVAGNVTIKDGVFVGAGSVIKNNILINKNVLIGSGTNVIKDIKQNSIIYNKLSYEIKTK